MHLEIHDDTTFRDIQDVFSNHFPWLRLAFYRHPHDRFESSDEKHALEPRMNVGAFKKTHVSGLLEILPLSRVRDVEQELQDRFGLPVQILRKDRNCWVQTHGLDDLPLKELNELSRNASDSYLIEDYEAGFQDQPL
jgi:hypothetical protein